MFRKIIVPVLLLCSFTQSQAYEPSESEIFEFERVVSTLKDGILSKGTFTDRNELTNQIISDLKALCPPDNKEECHKEMREVLRKAVRNYDRLKSKGESIGAYGLGEAAIKMTEDELLTPQERITFQEAVVITSILTPDDHPTQEIWNVFKKLFDILAEIDNIDKALPEDTSVVVVNTLGLGSYFFKQWLQDQRLPDDDYYSRRYLRSYHKAKEVEFEDVKCGAINTYVGRILGDPTHAAIMGTMCVAERFVLEEADFRKEDSKKKGKKKISGKKNKK